MTTPLEDLALVADGETVALVSRQGAVEWFCLPRFDSPATCASLLGSEENGHWTIAPDGPVTHSEQRYRSDTLVLETEMTSEAGTIRIIDHMPIRDRDPTLVRIVEGVEGTVPVRFTAAFRFDYGNMPPWIVTEGERIVMHVGPDKLVLTGLKQAEIDEGTVHTLFTVKKGSSHAFVLTYGAAHDDIPEPEKPEKSLKETEAYWRDWLGRFDRPVPYEGAVRRSLLALKALIHRPTGGLVAAATTSLPEIPAGKANWDYRYCWLRDAAFTVRSLVECGYLGEATAWRDWILRAVAGAEDKMQIMYRVDGSRRLDEAELGWLPGYRFARPVRVGNAAAGQFQLDVYGEVINMLHISSAAGMERTDQGRLLERLIIAHLEKVWMEPDHGLWEDRGEPRHYVSSKAMAWLAFDRFLHGESAKDVPAKDRRRLSELRDHIHAVICAEGFDEGLGSFTSYFGGQDFDASLLLLPKIGFLPMSDERMAATVAKIETNLVVDGFVRRARTTKLVPEGAFLACCFWLAECQLLDRRREDAVRTMERAMSVASPLGLLSEEYDPEGRRLSGNYPQALSHLALISAVLALDMFDKDKDRL
ncbi:MAG: glycoside hydrolase family 15 protein [Pararhizobium sp.]